MANPKQKPQKNASPSSSTAREREGLGYDSGCQYAGETYSHGSIVTQGGVNMQCDNGTWKPAKRVAPTKPARSTNKGTQ
jgi:hypothetical protein